MRVSLCVWLMMLPTLVFSGQVSSSRKAVPVWTPEQIDNAWIRVPWSHGEYNMFICSGVSFSWLKNTFT